MVIQIFGVDLNKKYRNSLLISACLSHSCTSLVYEVNVWKKKCAYKQALTVIDTIFEENIWMINICIIFKIYQLLIRTAVMYTIGYNVVKIFNKIFFLKHGVRNLHRFTKKFVQCTVYTLLLHIMVEKCWQTWFE